MVALIARTWQVMLGLMAVLVSSMAVTAMAATPPGTVITNTAQVQWSAGGTPFTASAQHQITVSQLGTDLAVVMTGPTQVPPSSPIVWKAIASNVGPAAANGAQVSFIVPPGVTAISGTCVVLVSGTCGTVTVGTPTPAGTPVTITLPTFPAGGRVEITLRGTSPATPGTINNQVQVAQPGFVDPTPANNVAAVPTQILAGAAVTGTLSGRVWLDANHDRVRDASERLLRGYTVRIYDATGSTVVAQVVTGDDGAYGVPNLPANVSYQIEFRDPAGNVVFGLPVTTETIGVPTGFASTTACSALAETGPANFPSPVASGNCYSLTTGGSSAQVQRSGRILVALQPGDNVIEQSLPLDPSGVVYDSVTRAPVAGATVRFTGPAGFNPAQHLLGGAANQNQVTGADGFYQYWLVGNAPPGVYTITVTPPAGYVSPSTRIPPLGTLDPTGLGNNGVLLVQPQSTAPPASQPNPPYHLTFDLAAGDPNVINNHVPIDPQGVTTAGSLVLRKNVSKPVAAVGDFVQYQLSLSNPGTTSVANVTVSDRLPPGFRFRLGTAQINGVAATNPTLSSDGRSLTFALGNVAGGAAIEIRYVTEITSGASTGDAINSAQALGTGAQSLVARATVQVKEDLFRSRTILLGRVIEVPNTGPKLAQAGTAGTPPVQASDAGLCNSEQFFGKGVEGARIFMEDGTYVRTDKEGKWHIEGVKPGTHVVQLDVKSLPEGYEPVLCEDNTRHGGRAFSQFVNVRGGTMWRADFYVRNTGKSTTGYEAGHRLLATPADAGNLQATVELKGVTAGARNLSTTIMLPKGLAYVPGSARMSGAAFAEPEANDNMLVFRAGDVSGKWNKTLTFQLTGAAEGDKLMQAMSQFQSADGETRRLPPTQLSLDVRWAPRLVIASNPEIIKYNQIVTKPAAEPAKAGDKPAAKPETKPEAAQAGVRNLNIYAPGSEKFDAAWLATADQRLDVVYPPANFIPGINATKVFVKHHPSLKIRVSVNGIAAPALSYDGTENNVQKTAALSRWGGLGLQDGQNKIVAVALDEAGKEVDRAERIVHFSGAGVEGRFVAEASTLIADGRTAPIIAVRIFDREGKPARHGTEGPLSVGAPYQSLEVVERRDARPLLDDIGNQARWRVTDDGLALIKLQPTTTSGEVVLTFNFHGRAPQVIRAWLKPELREWILVGLGEGTIGQRRVSGALENIPKDLADDKLWRDGRVAFYAKGQVKGEVLVTIAYDSDKERRRFGTEDQRARLLQTIDRKQYYTIYGDVTSAQHDAASVRKLYLKIERNQWYAMFGDFDTGMSVTELSRYSRTLNGIKTEFRGENLSVTAFATKTAQAFVKDELRPDGTSGFYRLTRGNILPNSDKVTIETRDRFRNEIVLKSEPLSRGLDYEIDYNQGTIFLRKALPGKDQSFNPTYIIVDYESEDPTRDERITAGGRIALRTSDGKAEVGVSAVHEGNRGARGDLQGVDATYKIDDKTRVRAEVARSTRETNGKDVSGNAYLIEIERQDANVAGRAYVRGQQGGFGLGQQAAAGAGTTKAGADVAVKVTPETTINARVLHERTDNAGAEARRSQVEARANYATPERSAYVGGRIVRDETASGETLNTNQVVAGASQRLMDGRLNLRVDSEFDLASGKGSADYPNRVRVGSDYKVNEKVSLFLDQEFTFGGQDSTSTTRVGLKSKPWEGGESASALNLTQTPDGPALSTSSSMTQTMRLTPELTVGMGMDRTKTLHRPARAQLNPRVPAAQGANATAGAASQSVLPPVGIAQAPIEDYTAVFAGATWQRGPWGATARAEYRAGETLDKLNVAASVHRDLNAGEAVAATALYSQSSGGAGGDSKTFDLRFSYAFRPIDSLWIVLSRVDYIQEESSATGGFKSRRLVTNNNINYQYNRATQIAFQYGAKYVFDSFDLTRVSGFTDLYGAEIRHDLGNRFDIGAHASLLHTWESNNFAYSYGVSAGFSPMTNVWLGLGYNFAGFRDRDFTSANATAKGWYLYLRIKADQEMREKDTAGKRQVTFDEVAR